MTTFHRSVLLTAALVGTSTTASAAGIPGVLPVQGRLVDAGGVPVSDTNLTFRLLDADANELFADTPVVEFDDSGFFTAYLGELGDLDLTLFRDNAIVTLEVEVEGDTAVIGPFDLGQVPHAGFAYLAGDAEKLDGHVPGDFLAASWVPDWSKITNVPPGLDDGDDDTLYDADNTTVFMDPLTNTFYLDQTLIEDWALGVCLDASWVPGWADITGIPPELWDGDDDTTYAAGEGLELDTDAEIPEFSVDPVQIQAWAAAVCYDSESDLTGLLNDNYLGKTGTGAVGVGTSTPGSLFEIHQTVGTNAGGMRMTNGSVTTYLYGDTGGTVHFDNNSGANLLLNESGGNVGIGNTGTPLATLHVNRTIPTSVSVANANLYLRGSDNGYGLAMGNLAGGYSWIQGMLNDAASVPLLLNPSGGLVGIGTTSPAAHLDVDNSLRIKKSTGNSRIEMRGGSDGGSSSSIYMYNPSDQLSTVLSDGTYNSYLNVYGGNVGIGTSAPSYGLHVNGNDATGIMIERTANDTTTTDSYTRGLQIRSGTRTMDMGIAGSTYWHAFFTDTSWIDTTSQKLSFGTNSGYNHLVINDGNVGIGTTTPGNLLTVGPAYAQSNAAIAARYSPNAFEWGNPNELGYGSTLGSQNTNGAPFLAFSAESGTGTNSYRTRGRPGNILTTDLAGVLLIGRAAAANADNQTFTEDVRISASGYMGIGTPSPGYRLDVAGDINTTSSLRLNGSCYAGPCTSDIRAKQNIEPITDAIDRLMGLHPIVFEYKNQPGVRQAGLIAQDVEKVMPQLVSDDGEFKRVRYDLELQMNVLAAVQEQQAEITSLRAENATIRAENESLKDRLDAVDRRLASLDPRPTGVFSMGLGGGWAFLFASLLGLGVMVDRRLRGGKKG